jgi:hypothetical protein
VFFDEDSSAQRSSRRKITEPVPQDHCEWQFPSGRKDLFDRFLGYDLALFPGTGAGRKQDLTVDRLRFVPVGQYFHTAIVGHDPKLPTEILLVR